MEKVRLRKELSYEMLEVCKCRLDGCETKLTVRGRGLFYNHGVASGSGGNT